MISGILQDDCWLFLPIVMPLFAALLCFAWKERSRLVGMAGACLVSILTVILCWRVLEYGCATYDLGNWQPPLGISLRADGLAILVVVMTAVTGLAVSIYAGGYFQSRIVRKGGRRHQQQERSFWPLWLMLWAGLNSLFLSADIFNLYVALEIVALSSVGLTALSGKPASQVAAMRYLLVGLLGSLSYLLGVGFLYKTYGVLELTAIQQVLELSPPVVMAMALITVGLLAKTALFPFHFWLPPAHANALSPVSAILSGLVINGGWYLLFRFWQGLAPLMGAGVVLFSVLGAAAIFWGAFQAVSQQRLKMLVAYSTVAQIGYLFILFPFIGLGDKQSSFAMFYFVLSHSFAKAAMFLAAGTIFLHLGHDRIRDLAGVRKTLPVTTFAFALGGVSLMGLPPSGGFIAKYLYLSLSISHQNWWLASLVFLGSCLTAVYVFKAVSRVLSPAIVSRHRVVLVAGGMEWSSLVLALAAILLGFMAPQALMLLEVAG